jgi:uncharacterized protein (DUF2252 family)
MKNLVFSSKSYDRKGKIYEAIEHHNQALPSTSRSEKFKKMKDSPYAFFRGSNHIFWSDFAGDWQVNRFGGSAFSRTWLQGDAHVYNMGAYLNDIGVVSYGFDDYDDSLVADYQYDVWRFAISMVLDSKENGNISDAELSKCVREFARHYLETIDHHEQIDSFSSSFTKCNTGKLLMKFLAKTENKYSRERMLEKWTDVNESRQFKHIEGKLDPIAKDSELYGKIMQAFSSYTETVSEDFLSYYKDHYKILDLAVRHSAGTGSLGLKRYYALMRGDTDQNYDDVILDVKQQIQPTAFSYLSDEEVEEYNYNFKNHAQCHSEAYRALSQYPDCHLGWLSIDDAWYSVRERSPFKNDFPTSKLKTAKDYLAMAKQWSEIMAKKHLQAARKLNGSVDPYVFEATINRIARDRIEEFEVFVDGIAHSYAKQVRRDWLYFCEGY